MKKTIVVLLIFIGCTFAASAQSMAKAESVKELAALTGMRQLMVQMMDQLFAQFKAQMPDVGDTAWAEMRKEIVVDELLEMMVPVYQKNFSEEEMREMIGFYKTPLGQKMIQRLPSVMREAGEMGNVWGQNTAKRMLKRLKEKGLIKE
ncbi:DUF2059 domain-containing protein [Chitinophaga lutea]|uniref:DUF2059 domain-containing protein n=1 Tax=Chitinophaga lutea TaxID=2488634 RepID=A0A3N4QMR2_9BACT|nr:DUF2059 domain-containing protein [Chitinophaga lutea]RPE12994.1 DUF2059 domain-containing protein [Chitinophaga lutea]